MKQCIIHLLKDTPKEPGNRTRILPAVRIVHIWPYVSTDSLEGNVIGTRSCSLQKEITRIRRSIVVRLARHKYVKCSGDFNKVLLLRKPGPRMGLTGPGGLWCAGRAQRSTTSWRHYVTGKKTKSPLASETRIGPDTYEQFFSVLAHVSFILWERGGLNEVGLYNTVNKQWQLPFLSVYQFFNYS